MEITAIASYLVFPGKNEDKPIAVRGALQNLDGPLFRMLTRVFKSAEIECNIPIRFNMNAKGEMQNEVRENIINFIQESTFENGLTLANRLRDVTTKVPGLGLLFMILGKEDDLFKIVISRFPADEGILAEPEGTGLRVEFLEKIFMKNRNKYKSVLYSGKSFDSDFWVGNAVDKQLNIQSADYWISGFLSSDFRVTSKAGTKTFAQALRKASNEEEDMTIQNGIVGLGLLVQGLAGQPTSIIEMFNRFAIGNDVKKAVISRLPNKSQAESSFVFDLDEYQKSAPFKSLEMDNSGILIAPIEKFDHAFEMNVISGEDGQYEITTRGKIVRERIRKSK